VFVLRDSMLVKNIERIPDDSTVHANHFFFTTKVDTLISKHAVENNKLRVNSSQVQIYISSGGKSDSIQKIIQPLASRVQEGKLPAGSSFIVRMGMDSLSLDSLNNYFKRSLTNAALEIPFEVKHTSLTPPSIDLNRRNFFRPTGEENKNEPFEGQVFSNMMNS